MTSRSKSNKGAKRNPEESKKAFIPDYKVLKMLSKEDLFNHASMLLGKGAAKTSMNKIKPNANNYVSKAVPGNKANHSTAIENLVNQALRSQSLNTSGQADGLKKAKQKARQKNVNSEKVFEINNVRFLLAS